MYTTHGLMTAVDLDEIRRDMDLDLCGCCESGAGWAGPDCRTPDCAACGHPEDAHA